MYLEYQKNILPLHHQITNKYKKEIKLKNSNLKTKNYEK